MIRNFLTELLGGFLVDLQVAAGAVAIGLGVGLPVALLREWAPRSRRIVWPCVRLMQAAPVYVVMYFVVSTLPRDLSLFGAPAGGAGRGHLGTVSLHDRLRRGEWLSRAGAPATG